MSERTESLEDDQPWSAYRLLVVSELKTIKEGQSDMRVEVANLRVEVAKLKTTAAIYGGLASIVVSAIVAFLVAWFSKSP